jgi:myo-inositol-1(or 4)-monophosphatase
MPKTPDTAALLDVARRASRAAGQVLLDGRSTSFTVATKSSATDMVTAMDRAAEQTVVTILAEERAQDAVVGEEGTARSGTSGVRWLVDPLDGTTNYLYDLPFWSVSLAAEWAGEVVVGVVFDPSHGETFAARKGGGAWMHTDGDGGRGRRLRRDQPGPMALTLATALVGTGFSYAAEHRARQAAVLAHILPAVRDIRRMGSAALDLCAVAAGRLDAYYERGTQPWDHAAGGLIAAEAGCWVGGLEGRPISDDMAAAAAPAIAAEFRELLSYAEKER